MELKAAYLSALIVLAGSSLAAAGPVVDAAERAEALQAEGKTVEALQALDDAVEAIWTASPLAFREIEVVEEAGGDGTTFRPGETLKVRVQPVGYGYGGAGERPAIGFDAGVAVENTTGQVLMEDPDAFSVSAESAPDDRRFVMVLSLRVPPLYPGDYVATFNVRDQNSDKTGSFEVPFSIAPPRTGDVSAPAGAPAGQQTTGPAGSEAGAASEQAGDAGQPAEGGSGMSQSAPDNKPAGEADGSPAAPGSPGGGTGATPQ